MPEPAARVLIFADEIDLKHLRLVASSLGGFADAFEFTTAWEDAQRHVTARDIDLCVVSYSANFRRVSDLICLASSGERPCPVVVLARAEEPGAERVALSLGAAEWFVRARITAPELERTLRNTLTRHQTVTTLRANERRARAAFDESADARIFVDDLQRCVEFNRAAAALFGLDVAPPEGVTLPSLLDPEGQGLFAPLWDARYQQREQEVRLRLKRPKGATMVYEVTVTAQVLPGCHLVVFRDVTGREELRARLAQSERISSLTTLASGLTHELNNPLQVLAASFDHFRDVAARLGPPHREDLDGELTVARGAADRLLRVVRDLAVFTRTEGEDVAAPVDLSTPLETAIRLTANTIRHRARLTRLVRRVPAVLGSVARLTQVFVNILLNAAQAIPEGAASRHEVHVSLDRVDTDRVQVAVSDTGHGMSPDVLARVFDPFFTTRPVGLGTGLGLSVCHGIVTAMGGEIFVESEPDRGTIFRVVLPLVGSISRPSTLTPSVDVSLYERRLVAVIDDDPHVCRSLTRLLQSQHEVVAFTSPREALDEILGGRRFDAVLCDVMMPEMSGIEVYQQVLAYDAALAGRLVFVTGGAFSADARRFLEEGQHRVIEKPATQATLLRAIARVAAVAVSG
jgi:PAS domain S-box-containing protein